MIRKGDMVNMVLWMVEFPFMRSWQNVSVLSCRRLWCIPDAWGIWMSKQVGLQDVESNFIFCKMQCSIWSINYKLLLILLTQKVLFSISLHKSGEEARTSSLRSRRKLGGIDPGIIGYWVVEVVQEVLKGAFSGDNSLDKEAKHGEHG